ncbi:MAG: FmdB family zinc ribbon protein [Anaerolineae bacterium]
MPIYEYQCEECGGIFRTLVQGFGDKPPPPCPRCGSAKARKLFSTFAALKSEESRQAVQAERLSMAEVNPEDRQSIARWFKKLQKETGEHFSDFFEEVVDRTLKGAKEEDLADIERDIPLYDGRQDHTEIYHEGEEIPPLTSSDEHECADETCRHKGGREDLGWA